MSACEYQVWSGRNKIIGMYTNMPEMICCGKPAGSILLPTNKQVKKYLGKRTQIFLCEEHRAFVIDAIMPTEKIITETPKGFNLI
jgi:hypothetical protein